MAKKNAKPLPPNKKKGGCLTKLVVLIILAVIGFAGWVYFDNKDEINSTEGGYSEKLGAFANKFSEESIKLSEVARKKIAEIDKEALLKDLSSLSDRLQDQLKSIANEDVSDVKKDVAKYKEFQTAERRAEVHKEMEVIRKKENIVVPPKEKKLRTADDALNLNLGKASEKDLMDAAEILKTDVTVRENLYSKDKKKNKDQLEIAITHARMRNQILVKIYEKTQNEWALNQRRLNSVKIRTLVAYQDGH